MTAAVTILMIIIPEIMVSTRCTAAVSALIRATEVGVKVCDCVPVGEPVPVGVPVGEPVPV
jgi:hypothetical protein